jgi:hypothetical protein
LDQQHYPQLHIRGRAGLEPTPSHLYNVHFAQQVTHHHQIFFKKKFGLIFATWRLQRVEKTGDFSFFYCKFEQNCPEIGKSRQCFRNHKTGKK